MGCLWLLYEPTDNRCYTESLVDPPSQVTSRGPAHFLLSSGKIVLPQRILLPPIFSGSRHETKKIVWNFRKWCGHHVTRIMTRDRLNFSSRQPPRGLGGTWWDGPEWHRDDELRKKRNGAMFLFFFYLFGIHFFPHRFFFKNRNIYAYQVSSIVGPDRTGLVDGGRRKIRRHTLITFRLGFNSWRMIR